MTARERILKSADKLFGTVGFESASTREIAQMSGINKALIHYHFKNKEALFDAVLDSYYDRLWKTLQTALEKPLPFRERFKHLVEVYIDFLAQNMNFAKMVQRESAGGRHIGKIRERMKPIFRAGREIIEREFPITKRGEFSAERLLTSFYGMIVTYFTYSGVLEHLTGKKVLSTEELRKQKNHIMSLLDIVIDKIERKSGKKERNKRPQMRNKGL